MITSHIPLCQFCGGVARDIEDLKHHSRAVCEQRIVERIATHQRSLEREQAHLEALHAVKVEDWSGALLAPRGEGRR